MKQKLAVLLFIVINASATGCASKIAPVTSVPTIDVSSPAPAGTETPLAAAETSTPIVVPSPAVSPTPFPTLDFVPPGRIILTDKGINLVYADGRHISSLVMPLEPAPFPSASEVWAGYFHWSHNGKYLAFSCGDKLDGTELNICILDNRYLNTNKTQNLFDYLKIIRLYRVAKIEGFSFGPFLGSISWSPDDRYVGGAVFGDVESPCVIEVQTGNFDCSTSNMLRTGLSADDLNLLSRAHVISWSSQDINKLVFMDYGNNNLSRLNLQTKNIEPIWSPPGTSEVDYEQNPVWSPDGKKITFVFTEPEGEKIHGHWKIQNYVVGRINEDGSSYERLIDGKEVYSQIYSMVPEDFRGGNVELHISSWSPDGRFLLFEVRMNKRGTDPAAYGSPDSSTWGTFYLDTQTGAVIPFVVDFNNPHGASANWGP